MASGTIPFPISAINFQGSSNDLNSPPEFFCFLDINENTVNAPAVSGNNKRGVVISVPYGTGTNYCSQLFMSKLGSYVMFRTKNGTWGEWKQLAFVS